MKPWIFISVLLVALASARPIQAFPGDDDLKLALRGCALLTADTARLRCFDGAMKLLDPTPVTPAPVRPLLPTQADAGKWTVHTDQNPVDDTTTVVLRLVAESGTSRFGKEVTLLIRCKSNETELFINWNDYLGDHASVLTRVGSNPPETKVWNLSSDSQATFYPRKSVEFIRSLTKAEKLVAQVTPYQENPITAIFDLKGLSSAMAPLVDTCAWNAP